MDENKVHGNNISTTIVSTNDMTTHNADCFDSLRRYHPIGLQGHPLTPSLYSRDPETHISSHRTMTIFCPARSSLATILAKRPRRWSRPSITLVLVSTMVPSFYNNIFPTEGECKRRLVSRLASRDFARLKIESIC